MRLFITIAILATAAILLIQNPQSISLVFFGINKTSTLPLGIWILLFTTAGIITSLFYQWLNSLTRNTMPSIPKSERNDSASGYASRRQMPQFQEPSVSENKTPILNKNNPELDWDLDNEDWDIEKPPITTVYQNQTQIQEPIPSEDKSSQPQDYQPAETASKDTIPTEAKSEDSISRERPSSIYSYTYRDNPQLKESKTEKIYDANYRVINASTSETSSTEKNDPEFENDEDWKF